MEGVNTMNDCPKDSYVLSEEECKSVPEKLSGTSFNQVLESSNDPVGCFRYANWIYYNKRNTGNAFDGRLPICGNCKSNIQYNNIRIILQQ